MEMKEYYEKEIEKRNAIISLLDAGYKEETKKIANELSENISCEERSANIWDLEVIRDAYMHGIKTINEELKYYEGLFIEEEKREQTNATV